MNPAYFIRQIEHSAGTYCLYKLTPAIYLVKESMLTEYVLCLSLRNNRKFIPDDQVQMYASTSDGCPIHKGMSRVFEGTLNQEDALKCEGYTVIWPPQNKYEKALALVKEKHQ
jgi:hypothetical protein